jgi:hypothetical protein
MVLWSNFKMIVPAAFLAHSFFISLLISKLFCTTACMYVWVFVWFMGGGVMSGT